MSEQFSPRHMPALIAASTMTFGGLWSYFDPRAAMLEFGLPDRIASTPGAAAVMHINNARTTVLGTCLFALYFTRQRAACDTVLAILGAYAGLVDSYVVWKEGNPRKAGILCMLSFMASVDSTVITTSLPTVTREFGGAGEYVWITNSSLFACTVPQPLYGQLANIFGRRSPLLAAIALFALGSGIAGGARSLSMLAGRTIQGLGSGGLLGILLALNVQYKRSPTWAHALARVDFLGNALFIPAMVALFFGLIMGGQPGYPWASWHVILPLVLGPSVPNRLFRNRTSATGFLLIFLAAVIMQALAYFLPVYFQAVRGASPLLSGVYFLPFALAIIPFGGLARAFLSQTGRYRPLHWAGFALSVVGAGLFSTLWAGSSQGAWIGFQILAAGGTGLLFTATLPWTLAALPESDVAAATAAYSFVRSPRARLGRHHGRRRFQRPRRRQPRARRRPRLPRPPDRRGCVRQCGPAWGLPSPAAEQVVEVYERVLSRTWLAFVGVVCLGFLVTFAEKHVELRKDHATEFGAG
ncbi:MFS general substrate transporter [Apiospora aurea]|uniref:MFS general substrate transporter n=1 Tax=Apiospora aurea TaxID=335848 RepID=A0ABR1QY00_9PEZI